METGARPSSTGFAPYEAPDAAGGGHAAPPRVFYGIDSRRVTLRECSWGSWGSVPVFALLKLLRIKVSSATDDPAVESLAAFEVPAGDVPGVIVQRFATVMQQLKALGFHSPVWHVIEDDANRVKTYLATLQGDTGRVWARVHHRVWGVQNPPRANLYCELVSELGDGSFLWSLSSKADLAAPASCTVLRDVGAPPARLLARHLSELRLAGVDRVKPADSPDALRAALERHHAAVRDFHLARGVFVRLTAEEEAAAVAFQSSVATAKEIGSRYPDILAEVDRLQHAKASRANGLLILLASAALFVGVGLTNADGNRFSPRLLAIVVGVLFFHELGHWVAMRTFGYRNLKMFFIPFFGAAVSGRHYNVPGWKKVIVSLMGPLPGIVVGAVLGALGVRLHHELLIQISITALLLNGFNLIPMLPLDGGWVVQAILFSRHHLLELLFRIATLIGLVATAALVSDKVLLYVAIGMAVSLPAMYRLAKITNALRRERLPGASEDGQTLPQATADVIVGRVKAAFPAKLPNKVAAQYTLQIFENINARPPGVLASLGLGLLQFGAIAFTAGAASLIYVVGHAAMTPKLDAATMAVVRTPGDSALAAPRNLIVATFAKPDEVPAAIGRVQGLTLPGMGLERFGQTVLVSLPFENVDGLREAQTSLEHEGTTLFVATPEEPASMELACTASSVTAGAAIERELGAYLAGDGLDLAPPWQPALAWSADDAAGYAHQRATYLALSRLTVEAQRAPEVRALAKRMMLARAGTDTAEAGRLAAERATLIARLRSERIEALRAEAGTDTVLVSAYLQAESDPDTTAGAAARLSATVGPLLGQLPMADGHAVREAAQWTASGFVHVRDSTVSMPGLRFANAFQGAPALVRWLMARGCADMQYQFHDGAKADDGDDRRAGNQQQP